MRNQSNHFEKENFRIGVIADTHVPDRRKQLHTKIPSILGERKVDLIVHTGDITIPTVLEDLRLLAPVLAVKGNRDFWKLKDLPSELTITINGKNIFICHGHGKMVSYLWSKVPYLIFGYKFERFFKNFPKIEDKIDVVLYGHSHKQEMKWVDGRLFFNPGSASDPGIDKSGPSIGILEISLNGEIIPNIIKLD